MNGSGAGSPMSLKMFTVRLTGSKYSYTLNSLIIIKSHRQIHQKNDQLYF